MRELNECRAEIHSRSKERIQKRRRVRRILLVCIPLCLAVTLCFTFAIGNFVGTDRIKNGVAENMEAEYTETNKDDFYTESVLTSNNVAEGLNSMESFSFSFNWGCFGESFYDSESGRLVKTTAATKPEDYVTVHVLTDNERKQIYDLIMGLDLCSYPDRYNPHTDGTASDPSMTLILSVKTSEFEKSVTAADVAATYECKDEKGQKFLSVCMTIADILMGTEEWRALPDYEFYYA